MTKMNKFLPYRVHIQVEKDNKQTDICLYMYIDRQMYIPYGDNYYEDKENIGVGEFGGRLWGCVDRKGDFLSIG